MQRPDGHATRRESSPIDAISQAVSDWRDAVVATLDRHLGSSPSVRKLADGLQIGRGLAHRLSRIARATELVEIAAALPGTKARHTILDRLLMLEPGTAEARRLESTLETLDDVLAIHAPSSSALLAILSDDERPPVLRNQYVDRFRERFEIDSVLHGASAECFAATQMLAPASDGEHLDVSMLQVIEGLRVWREGVAIEVYRTQRHHLTGRRLFPDQRESLVPEASSPGIAERLHYEGSTDYKYAHVYAPGELGASDRIAFGEFRSGIGFMTATEAHEFGEIGCPIWYPVRQLVLDLMVRHDVRLGGDPETALFHHSGPQLMQHPDRDRFRAPASVSITRLKGTPRPPDDLDAESMAAWHHLHDLGARRLESRLEDFVCFRVQFPCPPTGGLVLIKWPLVTPEA